MFFSFGLFYFKKGALLLHIGLDFGKKSIPFFC